MSYLFVFCRLVCSEPPKVEVAEKWEEQQLATVELYVQTHNKNPVDRVGVTLNHC